MEQSGLTDADRLMGKLQGFRISCAIHLAAKLELTEHLMDGPKSVQELAALCSVAAGPLYQIMRSLAAEGIYREETFEVFSNTNMSRLLHRDAPGPAWNYSIIVGELYVSTFANLFHSVKTGQSAFADLNGMSYWDYLGRNDELGAIFDNLMTRLYDGDVEYLLNLYDFTSLGRLLDVGGGRGSFVRALMARHPEVECGLFELPAVSGRNELEFAADGLGGRCEILSGSFLEEIPSGFDAYLVKSVLHNWDDEHAARILRNCRAAGGNSARLVIVDFIVPPGNEPSFAKGLDLTMLALFGGKERSLIQFDQLLAGVGYRIASVVEGESQRGLAIIVADPV
ncbi:methyltransferase [Roseibium sp.]|uniref:methyltransferase n=2 Tax=Roseibium sp. TaxID=1936156 RepID=UPI003D14C442